MAEPPALRVIHGDVLPALSSARRPPPAPFGLPILARMRNMSDVRQFESYTALERAINSHLAALDEQVELQRRLAVNTARMRGELSELPAIQENAAAAVRADIRDAGQNAQIRGLEKDIAIAQLERQLKIARGELDPAPVAVVRPPSAQDNVKSELQALLDEVRAIETAFDEHINDIIRNAGCEDALDDEARMHVDNLRMLRANQIQSLYDKLQR